ncbi:MAG: DUF1385 domain-containing protein [Actinobacteria bacterium]|nr:DUF1385 domain-containing protein [Actinomycetota bacterium]NIX53051.1 DUF1385 domain-containing protein [Actinomycetota bacterium]
MSRHPNSTVGGQAVIEGVMMRAPAGWAVAVRTPEGSIVTMCEELPRLSERKALARMPMVRGVLVLWESLSLGMRALTWSAEKAVGEEEEPITKWQMALSILVAIAAVAVLFIGAPLLTAKWLAGDSTLGLNIVEGVIRIIIFVGYIWAIGRSAEIKRVFQYHGAEHKTIHAFEAGDPLVTPEIQKYSPAHPRCGTSFLLLVVLASIVVFSFVPHTVGTFWLVVSRLLLIPVIAGVSYEILRASGLRSDALFGRIVAAPGLWLQKLTTGEPDDDQVEVAVASLLAALDDEAVEEVRARGDIVAGALEAYDAGCVEEPADG